ncbi:hypothetical protein GUJ93_ZPchr0001g32829 [Zizania palustris]|uniref:Uncharacterized protein n=1 Tax=Zizania palustris TaxID=103762 RepID=A0A8J5RP63_ZIZPA|nr:hypothetical protein GUJ93_ZPchr0001g32829 [Zizania palustris]
MGRIGLRLGDPHRSPTSKTIPATAAVSMRQDHHPSRRGQGDGWAGGDRPGDRRRRRQWPGDQSKAVARQCGDSGGEMWRWRWGDAEAAARGKY